MAIEQALDDSPLLRYIAAAAPQLRIERNLKTADGFALEKNRAALAVVAGFFVLLFYALADSFFLNPETYAVTPPLTPFLAAGGLAALAAGLWDAARRGAGRGEHRGGVAVRGHRRCRRLPRGVAAQRAHRPRRAAHLRVPARCRSPSRTVARRPAGAGVPRAP
ncbi:MAG: hypothetical protein MZV70_39535 [Desulfobacterales bacterium]|nr:hypothetical protein [Desulfobacterales bacterium]